jgi:5'-nucleotidase
VCVAQAWQYSRVVGELNLKFRNGKNVGCDGTPHLLVNKNSYTKEVPDPDPDAEEDDTIDVPLTGVEKWRFQRFVRNHPNASLVRNDRRAQSILDGYAEQVDVLSEQVIGTASEELCAARFPGQPVGGCAPDAESVSEARLDVNGGFIQQIVTDAYAARAFRADMAIQNGGGVRDDLLAGDITIGDVYTILPFANTLVELTLSGQEVIDVIEDALSNRLDDGGSTGSYPYGSKVRWHIDASKAEDGRVSGVEVYDPDTATWAPIDTTATYVVATNSFIASGRDGYDAFGDAFARGDVVDTYIDYAQGFIDWLQQDADGDGDGIPDQTVTVPDPSMFSTQSYTE